MKALFIGGCADGQWHVVPEGTDRWTIANRKLADYLDPTDQAAEPADDVYAPVKFAAGGSVTTVWICEGLTGRNATDEDRSELALHALISGYGVKTERGNDAPPAQRAPPPGPNDAPRSFKGDKK